MEQLYPRHYYSKAQAITKESRPLVRPLLREVHSYSKAVDCVPHKIITLASFPGLVHLSLAVQNLCRRLDQFYHMMCAVAYITITPIKPIML